MVHDLTSEAKVAPPVLDLAPFFENESGHGVLERRRAVLEGINKAAQEWGLFQVINHGLDSSLLSEALENVKNFLAEEKSKLKTDSSVSSVHDSGMLHWYETVLFTTEDHPVSAAYHPTNFRSKTEELARQAQNLAEFLLTILSQSLGLSEGTLTGALKETCSHYHLANCPATTDDQVLALPKHQDANYLTLIAQLNQVEGYQLLKDAESKWLTVQTEKDALIVNIGDVLQVLTNGNYKSGVHRVVSNKKERFSFVYSYLPGLKEEIAPLPQFTVEVNEPPRYGPFKCEELIQLKMKYNSTIEHYAI